MATLVDENQTQLLQQEIANSKQLFSNQKKYYRRASKKQHEFHTALSKKQDEMHTETSKEHGKALDAKEVECKTKILAMQDVHNNESKKQKEFHAELQEAHKQITEINKKADEKRDKTAEEYARTLTHTTAQNAQYLHEQATVQFQENKAVVVELRDTLAKIQHMLPRTFDPGSSSGDEDQNTNHVIAHWYKIAIRHLQALKHESVKIAQEGLPVFPGGSDAHLLNDLFGSVEFSDCETAGGADPSGQDNLQDESDVATISVTPYMLAFRLALTKEYMQRMNETQHPGHEYTLRVACSADRFMTIENINQWNDMLVRLCTAKHDTLCCLEDCSHKFEFVIVFKKKQTNRWERLQVSSVSVDVTGHFLMYIADAVWHLHRRLVWNKKLIAFLRATYTTHPEATGTGDHFFL